MSKASDFVIKNGVLKKYKGAGGSVIIPEGVTCIGVEAFSTRNITSVTIPDGVTEIGDRAFCFCHLLTGVTIPDSVQVIGNNAFSDCENLVSVTVPDSVTSIGAAAFSDCKCLADKNGFIIFKGILFGYAGHKGDVTIPDSVTVISAAAFYRCRSLTSVTIPGSVTNISHNAFSYCENLKIVTSNVPISASVLEGSDVSEIHTDDINNVPAKFRLAACRGLILERDADLESKRAESHMKYLTNNALKLCEAVLDDHQLLSFMCEHRLIKPKVLDVYFNEAEKRKSGELTALLLEYRNKLGVAVNETANRKIDTSDKFDDKWFDRNNGREKKDGISGLCFVVTGKIGFWSSRDKLKEYLEKNGASLGTSVTNMTDYLVTAFPVVETDKVRKARTLGVPVLSEEDFNEMIGARYKDRETIEIPGWVTRILPEAFSGYKKLTNAVIPGNVSEIGHNAFFDCQKLTGVSINTGVRIIGDSAFEGCEKLTSVTIPDSVTSIGDDAFLGCQKLTGLTIPDSVTDVGDGAFYGCKGLADSSGFVIERGVLYSYFGSSGKVAIPSGVRMIGAEAFGFRCDKIKTVAIPATVTEICDGAFFDCCNLISVMIPDSVTGIGEGAFEDCPSLTIHAPAGSYAEKYAKKNNIPFVAE